MRLPDPTAALPSDLHRLAFYGRLLAKAVRDRLHVEAPLPGPALERILGRPAAPVPTVERVAAGAVPAGKKGGGGATLPLRPPGARSGEASRRVREASARLADESLDALMRDVSRVDGDVHRSLRWILDADEANADEAVEDLFFSVTVPRGRGLAPREVELCPGGRDVAVDADNKRLYAALLARWESGGKVQRQLEAVGAGFCSLVPAAALDAFSAEEVGLLLNGRPDVDVRALRACTVYAGGLDERSPVCVWFWALMERDAAGETRDAGARTGGALGAEGRAAVLRFVTGSPRIPLDGLDPPFCLSGTESGDDSLPRAHTCFNRLVLPAYGTAELLEQKLRYACENAVGFQFA
jgi:hypothetical protein